MQTNVDDTKAVHSDLTVPDCTLCEITLRDSEVADVLKKNLNSYKASGSDLKEAASQLKFPLCKLLSLSLSKAIFPIDWKKANVTPGFKNNNFNEDKHYRPISLLSILSKCTERCALLK